MQWSLFVLILMGQCSFFVCQLYDYYFIGEKKTWDDAQKYCRNHFTDLATVSSMTDTKTLKDANNQDGAWIGLYSMYKKNKNNVWRWSLPGVEFTNNSWAPGEPNDAGNDPENCVVIKTDDETFKWIDVHCSNTKYKFVCYNDTKNSSETFNLIQNQMTWLKAQNYCREQHTDLVSGLTQLEDKDFKKLIKNESKCLWIGLFRDVWKWSDGSSFSFSYWDPDKVILINQSKNWEDALYYCRDHHGDLVSITNLGEQKWVQERAKKANSPYVWLGLRYTCTLDFWFWVSDEVVNYKNWDSHETDDCDMSGAMDKGGQHKWFKKNDMEEFNFICSK
ncbi:macrophage mannose receptor 1-like [Perca flavescens]|uniref:macrophage mannose receptor 1-like n=1 Tax=Perca flavescens TaxID=8167 RepID=UPI00106E6E34|nr:macrophage mannose receptor 1-like [Perca flavescens]